MYVAGLSGYGYQVTEAASVRDAKAALRRGLKPNVLLLDLNLPDESGQELIRHLREDLELHNTKIIVATAGQIPGDQVVALGADVFLSKPVELVDLFKIVRNTKL
jgi:CheY-like chemotaxis protein